MSDSTQPPTSPGGDLPPPQAAAPTSVGETLAMGGGNPVAPDGGQSSSGGGKKALLIGAGVVGLAVVGAGAWAAVSFFSTGAQPAEALPDTTLAYAAIDLDPNGAQKIEAVRTLNKFPAFKDELDLDTDDDVLESIFASIQDDGGCEGLDYAEDVKPWLGNRLGIAGVPNGDDAPAPVIVLQVTDAAAAEDGLAAFKDACVESDEDEFAWVIEGDWAVITPEQDLADQVVDDAAESSLADDADFQAWTDKAGDAGIVTMYASPTVGEYLAEHPSLLGGPLGGVTSMEGTMCSSEITTDGTESFEECEDMPTETVEPPAVDDATAEQLKNFKGGAAVVRFSDGALEMEYAIGGDSAYTDMFAGTGADMAATLPDDTAFVLGIGFAEGWLTTIMETMAPSLGDMTAEELFEEAEAASGLTLPEDVETLLGDSAALAMSGDFDAQEFFEQGDPSGLPIALKVQGSPQDIEAVLDTIRAQMPPDIAAAIDSDSEGDVIVIGPSADYREAALADGKLGDNAVFNDVVREADRASVVFFLNLNEFDDVIGEIAGDDDEVADNLEPLSGFGMTGWVDGDVTHAVLRITTD